MCVSTHEVVIKINKISLFRGQVGFQIGHCARLGSLSNFGFVRLSVWTKYLFVKLQGLSRIRGVLRALLRPYGNIPLLKF